ncbi:sucrase ferredoxin [Roseivivax sp. GX 12232]|uniref:sucrase ferredoxin n=1 Tax=Roseivivax sp. GX 12232 TaxID=2900547 RepID=UPI001E5C1281|nr:sucrase ferredoxin [Roseivivax sp. GX 12232]MCE0505903.1 sucrase ferredoxin [Roseivivax sp. GX 12232]
MSFDDRRLMHPEEARFCTEHSFASGEPLAGWGAHQARNILIRWPKARWRHSLRIADGMQGEIAAAIERVFEAGWRVNLIDRKSETGAQIRVYLMPEALAFDLAPEALVPFLAAVPRGREALAAFAPSQAEAPLVLCCTHGKHDRCCAKWGFAVYKALAAEARRRGGFDVWECTHLGGCRLSAGVLTMPGMRKYGRLAPRDGPALLAAEAEGRPYLPCYRGAAHLTPPEQVAEVTALKRLAPMARGPIEVDWIGEEGAARIYRVRAANHVVQVRCTPGEVRAYGACDDLKAAEPLDPKTIWHGEILTAGTSEHS